MNGLKETEESHSLTVPALQKELTCAQVGVL